MGTPYIGEIRLFAGNFAPARWAFCDGQLLPIAEYDALFVLIGTTYGGDGQETFALPNLCGRIPLHMGQGPGLSNYVIGEASGIESVTLTVTQLPNHSHGFGATSAAATSSITPSGAIPAQASTDIYTRRMTAENMASQAIAPTGGSQPHDNMMPFLCVSFIISLYGVFPSQS